MTEDRQQKTLRTVYDAVAAIMPPSQPPDLAKGGIESAYRRGFEDATEIVILRVRELMRGAGIIVELGTEQTYLGAKWP
jgi:hypothetical protein